MKIPVNDRVNWLLQKLWFGSQTRMAKEIGLSQSAISNVVSGKRAPGRSLLTAISVHPLVNPDWLLTGRGEPLTGTASTAEEMLPLARHLLPGPPEKCRSLLTGEHVPTTKFDYRPSRYWLELDPAEPPPPGLEPRDRLLLETDRSWLKRPAMLRGCPCIVRQQGGQPLLERLEFVPEAAGGAGYAKAIDRPPEENLPGVRMQVEEEVVEKPRPQRRKRLAPRTPASTDDPSAVPFKDIIAVGVLLQRRW